MVLDITEPTDFLFEEIRNIMEAINEDQHIKMLNETELLLNTLEEEFIKKHQLKKLQNQINKILTNEPNMRTLRLMQRIKTETDTSVEYYDTDRGQDERLFYQIELEEEMLTLQNQIRKALANIIKEQTSGTIDIG